MSGDGADAYLCETDAPTPDLDPAGWRCPCCRQPTLGNADGRWCPDCDLFWEPDGTRGGPGG